MGDPVGGEDAILAVANDAGCSDHVTIGDGARIGAAAGAMRDVPARETWGGFPARPIRQWMREVATLARFAGDYHRSTKNRDGE